MAVKKRTFKIDLFGKVLPALDRRKFDLYSTLSDEEKKGFADIVILRWMSSAKTNNRELLEYYIWAANGANKHLWNSALKEHPELKCMTLACAGEGSKTDHEYIKAPPSRKRHTKVVDVLKRYYPTANIKELLMFIDINEIDDLIDIGRILGLQKEPMAEYRKEVRKAKK